MTDQLFEIKHRDNGTVLFSRTCGSLKTCVEAAVKAGADLYEANLYGANLREANLYGANLGGVALIDGGQERRGYRFWAWRDKDGGTVYRAGCHEWRDIDEALTHYGDDYSSDGDRHECAARLRFLRDEAVRRRWLAEQDAAARDVT